MAAKATYAYLHKALTYCIAFIWLANGLACKVLNLVPRHQQIVARILGAQYATPLTKLIGLSEILMAIWIVSGIKPRLNAVLQIAIIATMNAIEFTMARSLLLFGGANAILAAILIVAVYANTFVLYPKLNPAP